MKERPILFSAPMVRAILAGQKTQTRRIVRLPASEPAFRGGWEPCTIGGAGIVTRTGAPTTEEPCIWNQTTGKVIACPYGTPGDRLWVRESWTHDAPTIEMCRAAYEDAVPGIGYGPYYRATEVAPDTLRWRPSIHMPRWASRIDLEVTGVRVERLHAISEDDAKAEGVEFGGDDQIAQTARDAFRCLWDAINPGTWVSNPWLWVVSFRRLEAESRAA